MSFKFKIIKQTAFEVEGANHIHYTVGYRGRVLGLNTLRVPAEDIKVEGTTITVSTELEVLKRTDKLTGDNYLDLVPVSGLVLAEF